MRRLLFTLTLLSLTSAGAALADDEQQLIQKGEYLARAGDCVACHTRIHGKPFAGGLAIKSPVGVIYSTNITPDKRDGIGAYTLDEFSQAVRRGIRKDGSALYPAMPYPSYSRLSDDDIAALYAYFMHGVKAEAVENKEADIPWPLSMRWPLSLWRMTFAPDAAPFDASKYPDATVARGAYLVQGLGHCGSCHTPRGFALQEQALDETQGEAWLAGGSVIDGWSVPSLRGDNDNGLGRWSVGELAHYLKTGRTDNTAAFGAMSDVVSWSTRYLTDADLYAMARYLKTLPAGPSPAEKAAPPPAAVARAGEQVYMDNCAMCHGRQGEGIARMFPKLRQNSAVTGPLPDSLVKIIREGATLPADNWAPSTVSMPAYANTLSAQQTADLVNYLRSAWGHRSAADITARDVEKMAAAHGSGNDNTTGWLMMEAQPYGKHWTFQMESHAEAQDPAK